MQGRAETLARVHDKPRRGRLSLLPADAHGLWRAGWSLGTEVDLADGGVMLIPSVRAGDCPVAGAYQKVSSWPLRSTQCPASLRSIPVPPSRVRRICGSAEHTALGGDHRWTRPVVAMDRWLVRCCPTSASGRRTIAHSGASEPSAITTEDLATGPDTGMISALPSSLASGLMGMPTYLARRFSLL